jgi:phosphate transport system substrate-binding protein
MTDVAPRFFRPNFVFLMILVVFLPGASASAQQRISIRGSDTLIYIGQRFAQMYERTSNDTSFDIRGGGLDPALDALTAGQIDLAQIEGSAHLRGRDLTSFAIGVQAIVVYVNAANPITKLTLPQLRSVFLGEITNWKALGGPDLTIHLYAGESTTGTLAYFQHALLGGQEPYPFVGKSNSKSLLEEIAAHREAIGYGSLDAAHGVHVIAIKPGQNSPAVEPTAEAIRTLRYPIARYVTWVAPRFESETMQKFCTWVLSPQGQLVVEGAGFQPLLPHGSGSARILAVHASP